MATEVKSDSDLFQVQRHIRWEIVARPNQLKNSKILEGLFLKGQIASQTFENAIWQKNSREQITQISQLRQNFFFFEILKKTEWQKNLKNFQSKKLLGLIL